MILKVSDVSKQKLFENCAEEKQLERIRRDMEQQVNPSLPKQDL